jgi:hypothetical protein
MVKKTIAKEETQVSSTYLAWPKQTSQNQFKQTNPESWFVYTAPQENILKTPA